MNTTTLSDFTRRGFDLLGREDPDLHELLVREYQRQSRSLMMVAASSIADPSTLACESTCTSNVTAEGYPGERFHAGCQIVDEIERLAVERARALFGARYANVQPHSGSSANEVIIFNLLKPGETILGLELNSGGHLTHGSKASVSGQYFNAVGYGLDADDLIDYEQVERVARQSRPRLIVCGASAYPRRIDFARFRQIADEVGAFLLADISHIAGLVAAGEHPSPVDHAHFTTTSFYKQLYGPRGGLILIGKDADAPAPGGRRTLAAMMQRAVFPFFQGTPHLNTIAAKARALGLAATPQFKQVARRIVADARALAGCLGERGYRLVTGGTDNHIVLIDVLRAGVTGLVAERALEECDIVVNRNRIPGDRKEARVASGVRLGTNSLALRGLGEAEMQTCAELFDEVLTSLTPLGDEDYRLDEAVRLSVRARVHALCREFPIPRYDSDPGAELAPARGDERRPAHVPEV
jgi:glycine hydroxymethyltransferase